MGEPDDRSDAERISIGRDPLQGERLHDIDDLWRVLERLGYERGSHFPTTVWDSTHWSCPRDDCDGGLELVDTSVRGLPTAVEDFDESVNRDDPDLYLQLSEAQSPTVPVVTCHTCKTAYEASFRTLQDPAEDRLPEPRIVETPGTLGGRPRVDGTRIGVEHIWPFYERGDSTEDIVKTQYPSLSEAHVNAAIEWAQEHPDRMEAINQENEDIRLRHDILQSAVYAATEDCLESIWSVLVNVRSDEEGDALRAVTGLLRNGFENADGLDISVDTDSGRIVIDVDDDVLARLRQFGDE